MGSLMWVLVALLRLSPRAEQKMQRGDWMLSEKTAFRFKMGDGHKFHALLCSRHQIDFGSAPASSVCVPLAHRCARLRLAQPCASGRPPLRNIPQLLCSAPHHGVSVACSNFLWLCSVCSALLSWLDSWQDLPSSLLLHYGSSTNQGATRQLGASDP